MPIYESLTDVIISCIYVSCMLQNHATLQCVIQYGLVYIYLGFCITFLHKQNPCISIKICAILRLCLNGLITHLFCLIQIFAFFTEVISIVVKTWYIIIFPL